MRPRRAPRASCSPTCPRAPIPRSRRRWPRARSPSFACSRRPPRRRGSQPPCRGRAGSCTSFRASGSPGRATTCRPTWRPRWRGGAGGRRGGGGERDRGRAGGRRGGRGGAPGARARPGGAGAVTANRLVGLYTRAIAIGGPLLLAAVLLADRRWTGQLLAVAAMAAATVLLRGHQVPLSKYSYLTQTGLVALAGSVLVGLPATALAVAVGVVAADWLWQRKMARAALTNMGREVIALVAAYGVYAATLRLSGETGAELGVELIPALFFLD